MNASFGRVQGHSAFWRRCLASLAAFSLGSLSVWALPQSGTPAPPLQFTQLLQAPKGARAGWGALHGKVVVLEFWATWCEACVADLPRLNKLVDSLDTARIQFISVDDEDPKVVQEFLAKRKMAGWVGIDTTGGVFARYGVKGRPTTVIVDGRGRIVAATNPENIEATDLLAVADGKDVKFKPIMDVAALQSTASPADTVKPLYEVSLSKAGPDAKGGSMMSEGPGSMDLYGYGAEDLISLAYDNDPKDRFLLTNPLPEGRYNLHAVWASADDNGSLMTPFLQTAISLGLNLQIQSKTVTKKAYVLKATEASKRLLTPTAMTVGSKLWGYGSGKVRLVNGSMDDLAVGIEEGLEVPVVNETGIEGKFDAELEFPEKDAAAAKAALLKTLGLELIQEDRPIAMLEVDKREGASRAAESRPQQAPKP
ncbi:MAG: redoxin domain-containing protein [Candidatus Sulfotelmatobacter sp.]